MYRYLPWITSVFIFCSACQPERNTTKPEQEPEAKKSPVPKEKPSAQNPPDTNLAKKEKKKLTPPNVDMVLTTAQRKKFRIALEQGRKLVAKGKNRDAILAFETALKIDSNNARVLSELGWASFKHNDLERAQKYTKDSIRHARNPKVKGASLYNMGRIYEKRAQRDRAATAYRRSLEVRPGNAIVRKRLESLEKAGATAKQANARCTFTLMKGTPPSPKDLCKTYLSAQTTKFDEDEEAQCDEDATLKTYQAGDVKIIPFYFRTSTSGLPYMAFDMLAVLYKDKWYVHTVHMYGIATTGYSGQEGTIEDIQPRKLLGKPAPEALLSYEFRVYDGDMEDNTMEESIEKAITVIQVETQPPRFLGSFMTEKNSAVRHWLDDPGEKRKKDVVHQDEAAKLTFEKGHAVIKAVGKKRTPTGTGRYKLGKAPFLCYAAPSLDWL